MTYPPRPTVTKEMIAELADKIYPGCGEVIARHYEPYMDSFELCKELDRYEYWDTTRDDMDKLDVLDSQIGKLGRELEKAWGAEHNPQPQFAIGDRIKSGRNTGEITGLCSYSPAYYLVKKDGQVDSEKSTSRLLIKFEDAQPA